MNENVQILEGNTTRRISPIDKVEVDTTTEGETSMWVPKNDHTTGVLHASENGIYIASEDGYDSYSEVVIRVEKRIDDGDLIDESGTDWKDIDFDGDVGNFDELDNWDVDTLEEFSDDLEGFDDLFNDEDKWDEEKEKPITEDEMDDFTGDSISGIDPEDGNVYEYSVDAEGNLTKEMLPSSIHIVVPPWKREYENGEEINFYGMHVYLLDKDGHPFKTEQYPTGEIPFEELMLPVTIAEGGGEIWKWDDITALKTTFISTTISDGYVHATAPRDGYVTDTSIGTYEDGESCYIGGSKTTNSFSVLLTKYDGNLFAASLNGLQQGASWNLLEHEYESGEDRLGQYKTVGVTDRYTLNEVFIQVNWGNYSQNIPESTRNPLNVNVNELTQTSQEIPVQWIRSDGEMLEDKFSITISPEKTTENTSNTSDSGSGHTSGGF